MLDFDIIIIGHIMKEIIYLSNSKVIGPVLGSPAAYASTAAKSLGRKIGLVSVIGKDMLYSILRPIIDADIDLSGLVIKGQNSRSTKLIYDQKCNKKVLYEKSAPNIQFRDIPKKYLNTKAFFICPMDFEISIDAIFRLKELNRIMMTDLGGFGGTVSTIHPINGNKDDKELVRNIVSNFDIVKASIEDCNYLFSNLVSYNKAIKLLHYWGARIVIITLGEKGSVLSDGDVILKIPAIKAKVVDTTGAGDVYSAAFLSEYLKTKDLYKSGIFASVASSIIIEKTGGVSLLRMPSRNEIEKRLTYINK